MHYHVGHGLAGYGPEGNEDTQAYATLLEAAEDVCVEAQDASASAYEAVHVLAGEGEYEQAYQAFKASERLSNVADNLNVYRRLRAPLYQSTYQVTVAWQVNEVYAATVDEARRIAREACALADAKTSVVVIRDGSALLEKTVQGLLAEGPWDTWDGSNRIYFWECTENECAPREK